MEGRREAGGGLGGGGTRLAGSLSCSSVIHVREGEREGREGVGEI